MREPPSWKFCPVDTHILFLVWSIVIVILGNMTIMVEIVVKIGRIYKNVSFIPNLISLTTDVDNY